MKQLLLIGGTGVLSSEVTKLALSKGMQVTMINRGNRKIADGVVLIKSDKHNYQFIQSRLQGLHFDAVIDFLCYTPEEVRRSFLLYSEFTDQYFLISSCAVFDKREEGRRHIESDPKPLKIWSYSVNKYESEKLLLSLASGSKCNYTIIRPSITYDNTRIPYGISPRYGYHWTLAARVLADKPIIRWKEGKTRYNMMRVEDFAVGVIGLIGNPKAYNEDFNICSDDTPTFNDVLVVLGKILNHNVKTIDITSEFYASEYPSRAGEILGGRSVDELNSNAKIKKIVPEFRQNINLYEGIEMTVNAYLSQNYQHGIDWKFDADTDRIIRKWCKHNAISFDDFNLRFTDYLGTATLKDRIAYWKEYYKKSWFMRIVNAVRRRLRLRVSKMTTKRELTTNANCKQMLTGGG